MSNSAGSHLDFGEIQAESVTHHLSAPVLRHISFKPSYSCISSIRAYFASLPKPVRDEELIVVGDRIFTDVVMANRMARRRSTISASPSFGNEKVVGLESEEGKPSIAGRHTMERVGPLAVWTEGVWQRESLFMRWLERNVVRGVERWIVGGSGLHPHAERFIRHLPAPDVPPGREGIWTKFWNGLRR